MEGQDKGRGQEAKKDEPYDKLHLMFDQLQVSPEQLCQLSRNYDADSSPRIASNNTFSDNRKSPSKCALKNRVKPYMNEHLPFSDQSLLPALNVLSFKSEKCINKSCSCNQPLTNSDANKACMPGNHSRSRAVIREPQLKLHHARKDHHVVLRAARLKLASGSVKVHHHKSLLVGSALKSKPSCQRSLVFGSKSDLNEKNFASLAKDVGKKEESASKSVGSFGGRKKYGALREKETLRERKGSGLDLHQLSLVLPVEGSGVGCVLHPSVSSRPCSCSLEAARVDDCTMDELACYFDEMVHIPKKMSAMAEMMYT